MDYLVLKDKVTHFSAQLKLQPKNAVDVKIGGKIKEINPPLNLKLNSFVLEGTGEEIEGVDFGEFYRLVIDDGIDELVVYVSEDLYEHTKEHIAVGNVCIFNGFTNTLTRKIGKGHEVDVMVIAYMAEPALEVCTS